VLVPDHGDVHAFALGRHGARDLLLQHEAQHGRARQRGWCCMQINNCLLEIVRANCLIRELHHPPLAGVKGVDKH
jgi:hypothetical protein